MERHIITICKLSRGYTVKIETTYGVWELAYATLVEVHEKLDEEFA